MTRLVGRCFSLTLPAVLLASSRLTSQAAPKTGADVLEAMRSAYAGKWYHTLTFTQKTTIRRQNGTDTVQTWHETLTHTGAGTKLRIDFGDLAQGNGVIYTPDSSYNVRGGQLQNARPQGNEFLPLIEGVYVQPVAKTMKELSQMNVDMSKVSTGTWQGKPVWIVGASSAADSMPAQFWIETDRKVLVRMKLAFAPNQPPYDVQLGGYVKAGGGLLATKIDMYQGGVKRQTEEYSGWKVDVDVDPSMFDISKWSTAPHWAKK